MDNATLATCCLDFCWVHLAVMILMVSLWVIEGTCRLVSDKISSVEGYLDHVHGDQYKQLKGRVNEAIIQAAEWNDPELMGVVCDLGDELKAAEDAWLTLRYCCA